MSVPQSDTLSQQRRLLDLWLGVLLAPFAWWAQLEINYTLVPFFCCAHSHVILHLVSLGALLVASCGFFLAWRNWQSAGSKWPGQAAGRIANSRFIAAGGLLSSGMFLLVILAQGVTVFMLSPCQI